MAGALDSVSSYECHQSHTVPNYKFDNNLGVGLYDHVLATSPHTAMATQNMSTGTFAGINLTPDESGIFC